MNFTPHSYTDFPPLPSTSTQAPNPSNFNTVQPSYAQAASRSATTRRTKIQHTLDTWKRTHPTLHLILQLVYTQYTHNASTATDSILETAIDDTLGLISRFGDGAVTRAVVSTVVMEMLNTIERLNFELMLQCDDDIDTLVTYQQRHGTFSPGYEHSLLVVRQRLEDFENVHPFVGLFRRLCGGG